MAYHVGLISNKLLDTKSKPGPFPAHEHLIMEITFNLVITGQEGRSMGVKLHDVVFSEENIFLNNSTLSGAEILAGKVSLLSRFLEVSDQRRPEELLIAEIRRPPCPICFLSFFLFNISYIGL